MTDARDVIAEALASEFWDETGEGFPAHADGVIAALATAGLSITETPDEWEWAVRLKGGQVTVSSDEDYVRHVATSDPGLSVVHRRPAGPWEAVDD